MQSRFIPLDVIGVASPCGVSWDSMTGDDRTRFCGQCQKNVYNLSGMTHADAEVLVNQHEGHLCVRFYRREDGTILTSDCPVGLRWARRKLAGLVTSIAAAIALLASSVAVGLGSSRPAAWSQHQRGLLTRFGAWLDPPIIRRAVMGESEQGDAFAMPMPRQGKAYIPPPPAPIATQPGE